MSDRFPSCFRPPNRDHLQTSSTNPNLTTCLYTTPLGIASITWSRTIIGRSIKIHLHFDGHDASLVPSFHLCLKPWLFYKKQGSKLFEGHHSKRRIQFCWDLSKARFLAGPEPDSCYYIAVVVDGEMTLLIGDFSNEAYAKTRAKKPMINPVLVLRREHVFGNRSYTTKARFGGETRNISIDCSGGPGGEPRLCFSIDKRRVLQVKRLRWKFRGNEKIEVDGIPVQVSWDVYNWIFDDAVDGHAVFMFTFEKNGFEETGDCRKGLVLWQPIVGLKGLEGKRSKKSLLKTSSSSSSSSASSTGSSSVLEWASNEETEMQSSTGFSLLVYAWKS